MEPVLDRQAHAPHGEPGGRAPAPEPLDLVQRFVNSYDHLTRRGIIETPEELDRWIAARGFPPGPPSTSRELRRVWDAREGLRAVLEGNNGGELDPAVLERVNAEGRRVRLAVVLDRDGRPSLARQVTGAAGVIAAVFAACAAAAEGGTWPRLKACPACGWVFYDRSKNRSGTWCTMAICGSRSKMRALRRRRGGSPS
jgi:predicted RNA-binding Zn ribbon-like protein